MNLLSFNDKFSTEEICRKYLKEQREKQGITCKKCAGHKHYWLHTQEIWKCAECGSWTNLRAGTIMEKSKMPVRVWFMCIHLMTSTKKAFSAMEMQRQLGLKRYNPVWLMMQKIRKSMGKRDAKYQLAGTIEIDDAFFEIVDLNNVKEQKRARGSNRQCKVLVMVESTPNPSQINPNKKNRIMGFAKFVVMDDFSKKGVHYEVKKSINPAATIISDGYSSFFNLSECVGKHIRMIVKPKEGHKKLPWVHTVISNAKRLLLGVHHSIGKDYLQNYLNEYTYKLNRRNFTSDLFDRMIIAGVNDTWY